jgi:hypothetical protein
MAGSIRRPVQDLTAALEDACNKLVMQYEEKKQESGEEDNQEDGEQRVSMATALVGVLKNTGAKLFHAPDNEAFALIPVGSTRQVWPLRTKGFRSWLAGTYYSLTKKTPGAQAIADSINVFEMMAIHEGEELIVHVCVAEDKGKLYLDLANKNWNVVEMGKDGWRTLEHSPVAFRRPKGLTPLPAPQRGGSIDALRPFVNVASEDDWMLLVAFLIQAFRPGRPTPVLCLHGEQGCAKSTLAKVVRALIDPSVSSLRKEPREDRDLIIAATNSWLVVYDNLSAIPAWLSDALCRLATGGGLSTRELFSDKEETIFDCLRPVVLTSIEDLASRGDLLERAIVLRLPRITDGNRQTEAEFWEAFEQARPFILGALLDAASAALANLGKVRLKNLPRMADFCQWVSAAGPALGWPEGEFLRIYQGNRADANELALDADVIVPHLRKFAHDRSPWEGTAADLLAALKEAAPDKDTKDKDWPKRANTLSGRLRRLAPNLRAVRIQVDFDRQADSGRRKVIRITMNPEQGRERSSGSSDPYANSTQTPCGQNSSAPDDLLSRDRPRIVRGSSEAFEQGCPDDLSDDHPDDPHEKIVRPQATDTQGDTTAPDDPDDLDDLFRTFSGEVPDTEELTEQNIETPWEF